MKSDYKSLRLYQQLNDHLHKSREKKTVYRGFVKNGYIHILEYTPNREKPKYTLMSLKHYNRLKDKLGNFQKTKKCTKCMNLT